MKNKIVLQRLTMLFVVLSMMLVGPMSGGFKAHAVSEVYTVLSNDGGVIANYNPSTKVMLIEGHGKIEFSKWREMAQKIDASYFSNNSIAWNDNLAETFTFYFDSPVNKGIKLCDTEDHNGLFAKFSGNIVFNNAVDLAADVSNTSFMFYNASNFNQKINFSSQNVTNMSYMFAGASMFNQPIALDTSNVKNMHAMFKHAESFNQPLSFDTANVTDMGEMFSHATSFNKPLNFNTPNLTDASFMFASASTFNQPINFDTGKLNSMWAMFVRASAFNQSVALDISKVPKIVSAFDSSDVKRVVLNNPVGKQDINAKWAFKNCHSLEYLEFSGLVNAELTTFAGDYYVEENGGSPIAKQADESYDFTDNLHYKVYLQSEAPLAAPTVSLSKVGSAIKVAWSAVAGATGYQVYRADAAAGPYTLFKTTTGLSYTNSGALVPGMPYFYKVRAYRNASGSYTFSDYSAVKGIYAPGALAKPAAPSLTLDENAGGIRLNWNGQPRITGYQIFRGVSTDKPFSYLKTTSGLAQVYTNLSGLNPGRPYYYKIRAYRTAGGVTKYGDFSTIKGLFAGTNEPALNAVNFNLSDNAAVSAPNVRVTWSGVSGADGYCVYRWDSVHKTWIGLKATGPNARVYTNLSGVVSGKTFFYGMRPLHISGGTTYYGNIGQAKGYKVP